MTIETCIERTAERSGLDRIVSPDRLVQIVEFCLVGASGILVDFGLTAGALVLGAHYLLANGAGYAVAVTWNFLLNYHITWDAPDRSVGRMCAEYVAADLGLFAVRVGIVIGLVEWLGAAPLVGTGAGILAVAALTFVVVDRVVFEEGG